MNEYTDQQKALDRVRKEHGKTGFTEDSINYRLVGHRHGGKTVSAIGETWDEALKFLAWKVRG